MQVAAQLLLLLWLGLPCHSRCKLLLLLACGTLPVMLLLCLVRLLKLLCLLPLGGGE
jgi:hypothetical protein